ncbi:MAG TPA: efflux RND transporter periplasmic adaptor subunit [Burkholderiales bacterium]|nr:efflux RND transporter periplasmic adaptor subunit [Burkholderiales bacterium]
MERSMKLSSIRATAVLAAAAMLAAGTLVGCSDKSNAQADAAKKGPPPVPVLTGQAVEKSMPLRLHAIGNVEPVATVAVKARVDGQILSSPVRDGQDLAKGDLLFQIDPKPYQSQLEQAQANLVHDQAQLEYLRGQEARYKDLLAQNFVSKEGYAQVAANFRGAEASVDADQAAIQHAKINLAYTTIRSPIDGRAGKVLLTEGNLVKANDTVAMVVINQLRPIYVSVSVPEQYLNEIRERQRKVPLRVEVQLEKGRTITGKLGFIDNAVDVATGTIKLRGIFANDDRQLWPGQFVESWVTLRDEDKALVVPTQALQVGPKGQYVYVVKPDSSVELRPVQVARTEGAESVIAGGLAGGETVVVDGASRILPGSKISAKSPEPAKAPDARSAGKAAEKS